MFNFDELVPKLPLDSESLCLSSRRQSQHINHNAANIGGNVIYRPHLFYDNSHLMILARSMRHNCNLLPHSKVFTAYSRAINQSLMERFI